MDVITPPPGIEVPSGMRYCELPAEDKILQFWGKFLDSEDTDTGDSLRWAELRLYRIVDTNPSHDENAAGENRSMYGKQMWLLYTIGHSLVYHDADSSCRGGKQVAAGDFPDRAEDLSELVSCPICSPADWETVPAGKLFRLELPWYTDIPCQSAEKVIRSLYRKPRCLNCRDAPHGGMRCGRCGCTDYAEAPRTMSVPGRGLIEKVSKLDPEIAKAAGMKIERL